ncbi:MAG: hypothetical protein QOI01_953 [Mycobacterium sp.]|jgi:hypothetical protein|nr:hypothetical protein [Mycobacterium sp.]
MPLSLTPSERTLRASLASDASWANTENRTTRTQPGRDAMRRKFEDQVDPERTLSPAERAKRAESARRAHFKRMALRSAVARRKAREARGGADAAS